MVDILPPSLRRFTLYAVRYVNDMPEQLLHLLMHKQKYCPKLEELFVDSWLEEKDVDALKAACQEGKTSPGYPAKNGGPNITLALPHRAHPRIGLS